MEEQNKDFLLASSNGNTQSFFGNKEKNEKDGTSIKSKRDEYANSIRKKARDEQLNSKRKPLIREENRLQTLENRGVKLDPNTLALKEYIDKILLEEFTVADFFKILEGINSQERFQQHYGVIGLRKILSIDSPPIQIVIDSNLVPRLIEFMQNENEPHLQLESAWALANVASGTNQQVQSIIDKGGIPLFVKLLNSPHIDVAEQAIWAIGNISGDSIMYRDMILKAGGLDPLIKLLQNTTNRLTKKHGIWALSNLCREKPFPKFDLVKNAIAPLAQVIKEEVDPEILADASWAMSCLSNGNEAVIQLVINTGILPALIKQLNHPFLSILIPCLRILGNIVTGNEKQTDLVMSYPAIANVLLELLSHENRPVRRETCWLLSNITAGTQQQIEILLRCPGFVGKLCQLALTDSPDVKRELTWVLSNAVNHGNPEQVRFLADTDNKIVIDTLVKMLDRENNPELLTVALECLNRILHHGIKYLDQLGANPYLNHLDSLGATKKIEELQEHKSEEVYKVAIEILETFYDINDPL